MLTTHRDKPKRRRPRFSVTRCSWAVVVMGVLVVAGNYLREQQAIELALKEISQRGGAILFYSDGVRIQFQGPFASFYDPRLDRAIPPSDSPQNFTDEEIAYLYVVPELISVDFRGTSVSDDAIVRFQQD